MKRKPKFWRYLFIGEILSGIGATRLAERMLQRALKVALDTNNPGRISAVYSALATIEDRKGNLTSAISLQQKAVDVAPPDEVGMSHCELALLYKAKGDYREATSHFAQALELLSRDYLEYRDAIEVELQECRRKVSK